MEMKSEAATEKFLSGYNCAQAILYAFGPGLGLDAERALKMATGLGAGSQPMRALSTLSGFWARG
jgi:hypothetical protein